MVYIVTITTREEVYKSLNGIERYGEQFTTYEFGDSESAAAFMEIAAKHTRNYVAANMELVLALDERDF